MLLVQFPLCVGVDVVWSLWSAGGAVLVCVGCAILAVFWWCELPFVLVVRSLLCVGCEVLVVCW